MLRNFSSLISRRSYQTSRILFNDTGVYENESQLEKKLKNIFEKKMKNDTYSLFADFSNYEKWLPTVKSNIPSDTSYHKLYKLPYWTNENDLDILVKKLEAPPSNDAHVKYFAAPDSQGKTCAILPAFLRSAERNGGFTHYIYLPFHNNEMRNFSATYPSKDEMIAYDQGAFIAECLKTILNNQEPLQVDSYKENKWPQFELKEIFSKLSTTDMGAKLLIHIDEHGQMCNRKKDEHVANFSKGVMGTLAGLPGVTVVATYVDKPNLPYQVNANFAFDKKNLGRHEQRLYVTLKFKLAAKLSEKINLHFPTSDFENFCKQVNAIAIDTTKTPEEILNECCKLCNVDLVSNVRAEPTSSSEVEKD